MDALLTIDRATVSFGGRVALADVSARLARGRVTAIAGPNGSGKSTLLGVLAGVTPLDEGSISWASGTPRPTSIAFVPQHTRLPERFPMTVAAAVAMGRWGRSLLPRRRTAADAAAIAAALDELDLTDLADRQLGELSGGQRQRTLIAQGVAQDARLFLLDEPTASLDARSRSLIAACLRRLADAGASVVVASHDEAEMAAADAVLTLRAGRLDRTHPDGLAH